MKERRRDYPNIINQTNKNGDAIISLKEYFDSKLKDLEDKICLVMKGQETALNIARESMEKRLDGMNEFRGTLKDQASTFLPSKEYDAKHALIQTQVDDLRLSKATLEGKARMSSVYIAWGIGMISLLIAAIGLIHSFIK